jgi:hypothetical protein
LILALPVFITGEALTYTSHWFAWLGFLATLAVPVALIAKLVRWLRRGRRKRPSQISEQEAYENATKYGSPLPPGWAPKPAKLHWGRRRRGEPKLRKLI